MAEGRQNKQWLIAGISLVLIFAGLYVISQLTRVEGIAAIGGSDPGVTTTMIAERTRGASPEMSWITSGRESVDRLERTVSDLTKSLEIMATSQAASLADLTASYDDQIIAQQAEINALKEALTQGGASRVVSVGEGGGAGLDGDVFTPASGPVSLPEGVPFGPTIVPNGGEEGQPSGEVVRRGARGSPLDPRAGRASDQVAAGAGAFVSSFDLAPRPVVAEESGEDSHITLLSNYLPAGSYAPAVVLSGVDASTGVTSQADPIPVLFRITGPAVTAGTRSRRGHTVDLTGCTVTGSARGDLSSERVYVRLLKLACIKPGQRVFETDVAGYMSGAGKTGSRGLVVSREGRLVSAAAVSGALSGLAGAVSSVGNTASGSDAATLNDALAGAGVGSVSGGVQNAADRLSEYYIERAEQYQPVVSMYGGTAVEVVFLEGFSLE